MQEDKQEFCHLLARYRKQAQLTQEKLASVLGLSKSTIANYERGVRVPHPKLIKKIAKTLQAPYIELMQAIGEDPNDYDYLDEPLYNDNKHESESETRDAIIHKLRINENYLTTEGLLNLFSVSEWLLASSRFRNESYFCDLEERKAELLTNTVKLERNSSSPKRKLIGPLGEIIEI